MKVKEIDDFDELLEDAEFNAKTDFEIEFIELLKDRYDKYEDECFLTDKQLFILQNMAK